MSLLFCRFFPHMSLPVLLDTKYLLLSYTICEYAVINVLWCTIELMFPFICRSVPVVGLVPLGYKYRALGCRTYLYTSTSLVSGRRYNMIVGVFLYVHFYDRVWVLLNVSRFSPWSPPWPFGYASWPPSSSSTTPMSLLTSTLQPPDQSPSTVTSAPPFWVFSEWCAIF